MAQPARKLQAHAGPPNVGGSAMAILEKVPARHGVVVLLVPVRLTVCAVVFQCGIAATNLGHVAELSSRVGPAVVAHQVKRRPLQMKVVAAQANEEDQEPRLRATSHLPRALAIKSLRHLACDGCDRSLHNCKVEDEHTE
eukprot:15336337-Ditylum_brightwellii.AAC.1